MSTPDTPHNTQFDAPGAKKNDAEPGAAHEEGRFNLSAWALRHQALATGLGLVTPDWPTGLAAPLANPPRVVAPVRAYLDGAPVEVSQATLAPGYVGFYLVEIQLPRITNAGSSDLVIEAEGQQSNHVRLYLQQ